MVLLGSLTLLFAFLTDAEECFLAASSCRAWLDSFEVEDPALEDCSGLFRDEDALDAALALVEDDVTKEDREESASRRERLSIALTASVLDPFDRDMSDR